MLQELLRIAEGQMLLLSRNCRDCRRWGTLELRVHWLNIEMLPFVLLSVYEGQGKVMKTADILRIL